MGIEANLYVCPHCGSAFDNTRLDLKTRRGICAMCGSEVVFPKRHLVASPSAQLALDEGKRLFLNANYEDAVASARTAISMSKDNVAALYIVNFYKAFHASVNNRTGLDDFFNSIFPNAEMEIEEEDMLKECLRKTVSYSMDYEEQILSKFLEYDDPNELGQFVENFCPLSILAKQSYGWLTPKMLNLYLEITKKVDVPKTWYALYSSLTKNPESPFIGNRFYLKTKNERLLREIIEPIGNIFQAIKDPTLKAKFVSAYNAYLAKFNAECAKY